MDEPRRPARPAPHAYIAPGIAVASRALVGAPTGRPERGRAGHQAGGSVIARSSSPRPATAGCCFGRKAGAAGHGSSRWSSVLLTCWPRCYCFAWKPALRSARPRLVQAVRKQQRAYARRAEWEGNRPKSCETPATPKCGSRVVSSSWPFLPPAPEHLRRHRPRFLLDERKVCHAT